MTVPECDDPFFDDDVTPNTVENFIKKFNEIVSKYNLEDNIDIGDKIKEEVNEPENEEYKTSYDLNVTRKLTNKHPEEVLKKDMEFLNQVKESDLFKTAPKEVVDFLNSLDNIEKPDPNEMIEFWITYSATILTELYSPEFFKLNPKEIIDDIDSNSIKVNIKRSELECADPYLLIKKRFIKAIVEDLNIDPTTLGKDFKDSFLAKTGIIKLDILGVDLTTVSKNNPDYSITNFMTSVYEGINKDTDEITYRDIETLIK